MGYYINPADGSTKEQWLEQHGLPTTPEDVQNYQFDRPTLPVCLIQNPGFTAAAICYEPRERDAFFSGRNGRQWQWYFVEIKNLKAVSPAFADFMK